jgi:acyl-CoA thioesterase
LIQQASRPEGETQMTGVQESGGDLDIPPIDRTWWSWSGVHGGLTVALLLRHARAHAGGLAARTVHASLLRPVQDGGLRLSTEVVRRGAGSAVTRATLAEGGVPAVLATTLLAGRAEPTHLPARPPAVAPPGDCPDAGFDTEVVPFVQHLRVRMAGETRPLAGGTEPSLVAWMRLDEPGFDPAEAAVVLLDSMPPAIYALTTDSVPVPTAEFSVHVADGVDRLGEGDGWSLIEVRTEQASGSWSVDSGALWSRSGTLLAVSRQTRRILPVG